MADELDKRAAGARGRLVRTAWACLLVASAAGGACTFAVCTVGWARADDAQAVPTRDQLIGAWRLVRIEYSGPHGAHIDPFYQAGSTGLLIYDPSGWMSVHIVGPRRPRFEVPAGRLAKESDPRREALEAEAFDSFYAYDGTWELDATSSELLHHVVSSLLPVESGLTYRQQVTLEGGRLVFTNRSGVIGAQTVRRKIWERAAPPAAGH